MCVCVYVCMYVLEKQTALRASKPSLQGPSAKAPCAKSPLPPAPAHWRPIPFAPPIGTGYSYSATQDTAPYSRKRLTVP